MYRRFLFSRFHFNVSWRWLGFVGFLPKERVFRVWPFNRPSNSGVGSRLQVFSSTIVLSYRISSSLLHWGDHHHPFKRIRNRSVSLTEFLSLFKSWNRFVAKIRKGFDGLSYLNFYDYRKLWSKLIHISDVSLWMILVLSMPCFVMLALLSFFLWVCLISAIWGRCSCYCHFLSWCSSAVMASVKDNEDASESPSMQVSDLHFIYLFFFLAVVVICL